MKRLENRIARVEAERSGNASASPVVIVNPETGKPIDQEAAEAAQRAHSVTFWIPSNGREADPIPTFRRRSNG